MKFKTTRGYFGSFAVRPKRRVGVDRDGKPLFSEALRLSIPRVGIDPDTKQPFGILDTDHLPITKQTEAKRIWGDKWQGPLNEEITEIGKFSGLIPMMVGEEPKVEPLTATVTIAGARTIANRRSR